METIPPTRKKYVYPGEWWKQNRHKYPHDWRKTSRSIKDIVGWKCESCGSPHCPSNRLTIDHLDDDPMNNTVGNVVALCWNCHSLRHEIHPDPISRRDALALLKRTIK